MSQGFKKWCECCKIMIPYSHNSIKDHEATHRHKKNRQHELLQMHLKARKEHRIKGQYSDIYKGDDKNSHKNQDLNDNQQEKWQSDQQKKEEYEKAILYKDEFIGGKIWVMEREDDTQRIRFRNTLTGQLKYEKPLGLQLEDFEQEVWDREQENPQDVNQLKSGKVKLGEWQEVKQGDGYLDKNRALSDDDDDDDDEHYVDEKFKNQVEDFEEKCIQGELVEKMDIVKAMIMQDVKYDRVKSFNSRLRELAENDIEIDIKINKVMDDRGGQQISGGLFKKRINNKKECSKQLVEQQSYE